MRRPSFQKEEDLLRKICDEQEDNFSKEDQPLLEKMLTEGLVEKKEDNYVLTWYGQVVVKAGGYKIHEENRKFEEGLPSYTARKTRWISITVFLFFFLLILVLGYLIILSGDF